MVLSVDVISIGSRVESLWKNKRLTWEVASVFTRSFNLVCNGDLIGVLSSEQGNYAYGLRLSDFCSVVSSISVGDTFFCTESGLQCDSGVFLSFSQVTLYRPSPTWSVEVLHQGIGPLKKCLEPTLAKYPLLATVLFNSMCFKLDPIQQKLQTIVEDLLAATKKRDVSETLNGLSSCIGLGYGLTPTGDDIIAGFLGLIIGPLTSSKYREERIHLLGFESIAAQILTKNMTTTASQMLFKNVLIEGFPEYTDLFINSLYLDTKKTLFYREKALSFGESSGADILVGIILGCYYLGVW